MKLLTLLLSALGCGKPDRDQVASAMSLARVVDTILMVSPWEGPRGKP